MTGDASEAPTTSPSASCSRRQKGESPILQTDAISTRTREAWAPNRRPWLEERLIIHDGDRIYFLAIDEIDWIEAADYNVRIHAGKEVHTLRERLSNLEERLEARAFVRIHRSALVNLSRVKGLEKWMTGRYGVLLEDGTRLRMSPRGMKKLEGALGQPI